MLTIVDLIIVIMVMLIVAKMKVLPGAVYSAVAGPGWYVRAFGVPCCVALQPHSQQLQLRLTEISIKFAIKAVPGS